MNANQDEVNTNIQLYKGVFEVSIAMIVVSFETEKGEEDILDKAIEFFADKVGLEVTERNLRCVSFGDKQSGYVKVTISKKDEVFEVKVESKDFEHWAKRFAKKF